MFGRLDIIPACEIWIDGQTQHDGKDRAMQSVAPKEGAPVKSVVKFLADAVHCQKQATEEFFVYYENAY